jgi:hypothetical protein
MAAKHIGRNPDNVLFFGLQPKGLTSFWEYPDTLHKGRFWTAAGVGVAAYTGTLLTLNNLWYDQYPRTSFHLFNDAKEWQQMDKAGHVFTAYFESEWLYQVGAMDRDEAK